MVNENLKQYSLFSESVLDGIREKGYGTKFKILEGHSNVGHGVKRLKTQLQTDLAISDKLLNILSISTFATEIDDDPIEIDFTVQSDEMYIRSEADPDNAGLLKPIIDDLYTFLEQQEDSTIVITLSNGCSYRLRAYYHGSIGYGTETVIQMYSGANAEWITFARSVESEEYQVYSYALAKYLTPATGGDIVSLPDLLDGLAVNYDIVNSYADALKIDVTDMFEGFELGSILAKYNTADPSVVRAKDELISIAKTSGLNGVVGYIEQNYKSLSTAQETPSGLIELTDNNAWQGVNILSGILKGLLSTVALIITAVLAVVNVVLTVIAFIVNVIVKFFTSLFQAASATRASRNDSIQGEPLLPMALRHYEIPIPVSYDAEDLPGVVKGLLSLKSPLILHEGAHYSIMSCDGRVVRYEHHLDTYDRVSLFQQYADRILSDVLLPDETDPTSVRTILNMPEVYSILNDELANAAFEDKGFINGDDGYLSIEDDRHLRLVIAFNILLDIYSFKQEAMTNGTFTNFEVDTPYNQSGQPDPTKFQEIDMTTWNAWVSDDLIPCLANLLIGVSYYLWEQITDQDYDKYLSWDNILKVHLRMNEGGVGVWSIPYVIYSPDIPFANLFNKIDESNDPNDYVHAVMPYTGEMQSSYKIPRIDGGSILGQIIGIAVGTIAIAAVAVVGSVAAKIAINKKRLKNTLAVEKAWDAAKADPSAANIKAYKKAVRKNNMFANIFGGTKYNKLNYWAPTSSTDSQGKTSLYSRLSTLRSEPDDELTLAGIATLITG